jgi:hypothetical protein
VTVHSTAEIEVVTTDDLPPYLAVTFGYVRINVSLGLGLTIGEAAREAQDEWQRQINEMVRKATEDEP